MELSFPVFVLLFMDQLLDTKATGKSGQLSGKEVEWSHWHFVFSSWVSMLSPEMAAGVGKAAVREMPVLLRPDQEREAARSTQLFRILVMMVRGRVLNILKSIGEQ